MSRLKLLVAAASGCRIEYPHRVAALGYGVNHRGFEMARYDYKLTDAGVRLADKKAAAKPELWMRIQDAAKLLNEGGNLNYMELSIAAKAFLRSHSTQTESDPRRHLGNATSIRLVRQQR